MIGSSGLYVDGAWEAAAGTFAVRDKYTGETVREVALATADDVDRAALAAYRASRAPLPPAERHDVLVRAAALLVERRAEIEAAYVAETGFTPADAAGELARAAEVLKLSAHEALRIAGEEVPVGATRGSENRLAFTMRVPVGVVAAIAPFNAPLVTVTHKIAPALAAGNGVVLKPAEATPLSSIALVQALADAGLPAGYLNLVAGPGRTVGAHLVRNAHVRYVTFTGSTAVGRQVRAESGLARTQLELGANSATIVAADADLDLVAQVVERSGYRKAGQVCTSVQRLLVEESVVDELAGLLAKRVSGLVAGDPRSPETRVGPLISEREAVRAAEWIAGSVDAGTHVVGGDRDGPVVTPALVVRPARTSRLLVDEAFAPVVALVPVASVGAAVEIVNAGPYGLQAGVFTHDIDRAMDAARRLDVGGVIVNDSSSYHADAMPYGGVKESGHGTEGPKYAVHDMTDPRIVVLNLRAPRC